MRRVIAALTTATLLLAAGCGTKSYELRMNRTLDAMRYQKRLDDNLMPPAKGKLEPNLVYLRPPKLLELMKEFSLTVLEPGRFDIAESFVEPDKQTLHVLGRVKRPKDPSKKKAANPADTAARGEFNADVFAILGSVYGVDIDASKAKEETKKPQNQAAGNRFKHLTFEANGKVVHAYLYGSKASPYEIALIFEFVKAENAISRIDLCLESFAVGEKARRYFSGGVVEEEGTESAAATGSPGAF